MKHKVVTFVTLFRYDVHDLSRIEHGFWRQVVSSELEISNDADRAPQYQKCKATLEMAFPLGFGSHSQRFSSAQRQQ